METANINIFYVYALLDTRKPGLFIYGDYQFEYEPFYIGKGSGNRDIKHLETGHKSGNRLKKNIVNKIIKETSKNPIVIRVYDNMTECDTFKLEIELIKTIGRRDLKLGPLTNFTNGGDGCSGYINSEETRQKMSKTKKGKKRDPKLMERIKNSKLKNVYTLIDSNNTTYQTKNLLEFCRDNSLSHAHMWSVMLGKRNHHKGWKGTKEKLQSFD